MKRNLDTLQIESRTEIGELMKMTSKYVEQNPAEQDNHTIKRFWDLLEVMDMEW